MVTIRPSERITAPCPARSVPRSLGRERILRHTRTDGDDSGQNLIEIIVEPVRIRLELGWNVHRSDIGIEPPS